MSCDVKWLKQQLQLEQKRNIKDGIYHETQVMFAAESNRFSGNNLTVEQIDHIYRTNKLTDMHYVSCNDLEETRGHFLLFAGAVYLLDEDLSDKLLKKLHRMFRSLVYQDVYYDYAIGEWKQFNNMYCGSDAVNPMDVNERMLNLVKRYNAVENKTIEDIIKLYIEFEQIHPFQDGNGRVGRVLMFMECVKNGLTPFIPASDDMDKFFNYLRWDNIVECIVLVSSWQEQYTKIMEKYCNT